VGRRLRFWQGIALPAQTKAESLEDAGFCPCQHFAPIHVSNERSFPCRTLQHRDQELNGPWTLKLKVCLLKAGLLVLFYQSLQFWTFT